MEGANSRVMIGIVFAVLLASCSMPTCIDAKSKFWCKATCELRCGGIFESEACFRRCYEHCRSEAASAVDHCDFGCVITSCLDSTDLKSKRSCADSCSQSCKATYVRA